MPGPRAARHHRFLPEVRALHSGGYAAAGRSRTEPRSPDPGSGGTIAGMAQIVRLEGVSKAYREGSRRRVVLDGASGAIERGELVVLLGRSGTGKSTLLNLVSGIDLPDAGSIVVAGERIERLGERERTLFRRRHVGFVFQSLNLVPTLSVLENVLLPLELAGRHGAADRERARELLAEVGLADRATSWPDRLSGGERQRVAIARALVHEPDLVLADEPTGNLDLDTGRVVLELLDTLTRRAGRTLLMVTHGREVIGIADRLLTIRDGKLVPADAPAAA
ncbi:MAG: ABC transporter ATP-binding protein [Acidobacteriota bacterium]